MKVENMTSSSGSKVANQFIIHTEEIEIQPIADKICRFDEAVYFQSYDSIIARKLFTVEHGVIISLDEKYWDYSKTTSKYRNIFLGENKAETQKKIDSGEYILTDLN